MIRVLFVIEKIIIFDFGIGFDMVKIELLVIFVC